MLRVPSSSDHFFVAFGQKRHRQCEPASTAKLFCAGETEETRVSNSSHFYWSTFGLLFGDLWSFIEILLGYAWVTLGRHLGDFWATFGRLLGDFWTAFERH
jgi:hypothetical protein